MSDNAKPKKPRPLDVPLGPKARAALNRAATRNHRSAAAQGAVYIEVALREAGYLIETDEA